MSLKLEVLNERHCNFIIHRMAIYYNFNLKTINTMATKAQRRKEQLERHYTLCQNMGQLFGSPYMKCKDPGKKISIELMKLEKLAHDGATARCNGETFQAYGKANVSFAFGRDEDSWDQFTDLIKDLLSDIFFAPLRGFFVNGDARGYALKCEENSIPLPMHTDWGRYQILSPEITGE